MPTESISTGKRDGRKHHKRTVGVAISLGERGILGLGKPLLFIFSCSGALGARSPDGQELPTSTSGKTLPQALGIEGRGLRIP